MKKNSRSRVPVTMNYIYTHWPVVRPFVPDAALPFDKGFGIGEGVGTQPEKLDDEWFRSTGFREFSGSVLPGGFFCVGCQNRGGSEYFFMMWYRDGGNSGSMTSM